LRYNGRIVANLPQIQLPEFCPFSVKVSGLKRASVVVEVGPEQEDLRNDLAPGDRNTRLNRIILLVSAIILVRIDGPRDHITQ
jgi:hypothetical protein